LAPLERATARGRASLIFDFEYVWEVYKRASKRRWGYYTLPVLWGDRLCARIELRADRPSDSLIVQGFWPEEPALRRNLEFATALGRALVRLADFNGAKLVDSAGLRSPALERRVATTIERARHHTTVA
jgi:uncharacterized protein YcaQ